MIKREEMSNSTSTFAKAADDEMLFILLGRDQAAPAAIRAWAEERVRLGKNALEDQQILTALQCADEIERSQYLAKQENK